MISDIERIYQNPVKRLERMYGNVDSSTLDNVTTHKYSLALQGEIDIHVISVGEDGCLSEIFTLPGEAPLAFEGTYLGRMTTEEVQQRLDELQGQDQSSGQ